MKQTNDNVKLVAAVLVGALVGGALGILLAPDKGTETRRKIFEKGEDLTDAFENKFQSLVDEVKKEMEQVKEKAHVFIGDGLAKAETLSKEHKLV
jgi:gas vesicle protein